MKSIFGVLNSGIGHQLGWVLLHSIWEGALIAAGFAIARLALRRCSANSRYLAACVSLFLLVSAPVLTWVWIAQSPAFGSAIHDGLGRIHLIETNAGSSQGSQSISKMASGPAYLFRVNEWLEPALPWMVQLWGIGVVVLSLRWYVGSRWVRRIRTYETAEPGSDLTSLIQELSEKLSVSRPVRLFQSAHIEVPMVVGWLRPVILLPASAITGLSPRELEAILAHELAHVRRHDYLVNAFQIIVETLMFYHPAVWWVSQCIREERELCCDDMVVQVCGDRMTYVRALVSLEETRGVPRLAFAANGGSLLLRVRRLLGGGNEKTPPTPTELSGVAMVAIGCSFVLASIWLLNRPAIYQSSALIKINPLVSFPSAETQSANSIPISYPLFLQTECLVIRSPAVLKLAAAALKSKEAASSVPKDEKEWEANTIRRLRAQLTPRPISGSSAVEIQAVDSDPANAARIANAVAEAYREHRLEQHRTSVRNSLDMLETRLADYDAQIKAVQQRVDNLRVHLKIPDQSVSENTPTVMLSAETLRHIESLRIESEAEYVKQRAILERLDNLDPSELPTIILAVGIQDRELANLSDSLEIVDQKLVSLKKEYGPDHVENVKATAQQQDLQKKIKNRTNGILTGLRAKCESMQESITALSNSVANAQTCDVELANRSRPYFEAKRDLDERLRFREILLAKIANEKNNSQLVEGGVDIIEDAAVSSQSVTPDRTRALALLSTGLALVAIGGLVAKTGRPRLLLPAAA